VTWLELINYKSAVKKPHFVEMSYII